MYVHAISERGSWIIMDLYKRNLLTLLDFEPEEIDYLLKLAIKLKEMKHNNLQLTIL